MNEKKRKDRQKLTTGPDTDHNQTTSKAVANLPEPDPRIVAVVQFLARRAAERDFKQLIEESRRETSTDDDEGKIQ